MKGCGGKACAEVLVIDDDAIMRDLMGDWLEGAGYQVRKVADCESAVRALGQAVPALIISDMFMPGACGAAAITELRRLAPAAALIAVSGYFRPGSRFTADEALGAGAARALPKPVKRGELLRAVTELIGPPK
ncbi:MAG TPA: response regulator [Burkholderiales bacterium]|nr:response regulator [Burkholderiales bacterium]